MNVPLVTGGQTVRRILMSAGRIPVRTEPSVKMESMATSASVSLDFKVTTVTWTSMSVHLSLVKTMARVWMRWTTMHVTVFQVLKVIHCLSNSKV